jgi:hypothetical protein
MRESKAFEDLTTAVEVLCALITKTCTCLVCYRNCGSVQNPQNKQSIRWVSTRYNFRYRSRRVTQVVMGRFAAIPCPLGDKIDMLERGTKAHSNKM